jgi:hypothetical protein
METETGKYLGGKVLKGENRDNSLPPTEIGSSTEIGKSEIGIPQVDDGVRCAMKD